MRGGQVTAIRRREPALVGRRAAAALLDFLVALGVGGAAMLVAHSLDFDEAAAFLTAPVAANVWAIGWQAIAIARLGGTFGHRKCGLRVESVYGSPIRARDALLRSLAVVVPTEALLFSTLFFWTMHASNSRGLPHGLPRGVALGLALATLAWCAILIVLPAFLPDRRGPQDRIAGTRLVADYPRGRST